MQTNLSSIFIQTYLFIQRNEKNTSYAFECARTEKGNGIGIYIWIFVLKREKTIEFKLKVQFP